MADETPKLETKPAAKSAETKPSMPKAESSILGKISKKLWLVIGVVVILVILYLLYSKGMLNIL